MCARFLVSEVAPPYETGDGAIEVGALRFPLFQFPLSLLPMRMTPLRRNVAAIAAFCILVVALMASSGVEAITVTTELPLQPCANIFHQLEGDNVLVSLNGTRIAFYAPPYAGAPYDRSSSLYFQWTDVREVGRNQPMCANTLDTVVYALKLHLCQCVISPLSEIANGVNKTGFTLTINQCPAPQQNLHATAEISVTNVTVSQEFKPTMQGSSANSFNYTNTYVQGQNSAPLSISPLPPFIRPNLPPRPKTPLDRKTWLFKARPDAIWYR